ncbi:hypothetical protein [Nonomuraea dietziae]|uniref:hypothetical protein n=1 Tax=Nonomuraea dietziae TaxID=65515 RepID=UPI0031DA35F7
MMLTVVTGLASYLYLRGRSDQKGLPRGARADLASAATYLLLVQRLAAARQLRLLQSPGSPRPTWRCSPTSPQAWESANPPRRAWPARRSTASSSPRARRADRRDGPGTTIVVLRLRYGFCGFMLLFGGTIFPRRCSWCHCSVGFQRRGPVRLQGRHDPRLHRDQRAAVRPSCCATSSPESAFSIFEAAQDGRRSTFRIFWRVYLPLAHQRAGRRSFILNFTSSGTTCSSA